MKDTKMINSGKPKGKVALIVPTIRESSFTRFVGEWFPDGQDPGIDLVVMEDNPVSTFKPPAWSTHLDWRHIDEFLQIRSGIIPRRSDTVRSFAYWWAWKRGYQMMVTLDDDCYPNPDPFHTSDLEVEQVEDMLCQKETRNFKLNLLVETHRRMLDRPREKWYNTLTGGKPRGVPYYNKGKSTCHVNHGLWMNVLDYDASTQLVNPFKESFDRSNRVVPNGMYFPMCGMNVAWRREATVLMYHLLMGRWFDPRINSKDPQVLPFDRFGDIWCGIFMKKIADQLGWSVSTGTPYIWHDRASNPFTNLRKEANGMEVNEKLWEYVDGLKLEGETALDLYEDLGEAIHKYSEFPEYVGYFKDLGNAMCAWAALFDEE